jgi:DNA-binding transcriptional ArsR family regulator
MLGTLGRDPERLWTVKELASALGQPATKLYHHMKLLEAAELVVDAETRLVSGIVEHRYRCAQRSIALDEALIGIPALRDDILGSVVSLVDRTRSDLLRYLHRADVDLEQVGVHHAVVHLTDAERAEALERLEALVEEIVARRDEAERTGAPRYAVFTLMHPFDEPEP